MCKPKAVWKWWEHREIKSLLWNKQTRCLCFLGFFFCSLLTLVFLYQKSLSQSASQQQIFELVSQLFSASLIQKERDEKEKGITDRWHQVFKLFHRQTWRQTDKNRHLKHVWIYIFLLYNSSILFLSAFYLPHLHLFAIYPYWLRPPLFATANSQICHSGPFKPQWVTDLIAWIKMIH